MTVGLPITNVVNVSASLTPLGASYLNLQTLLIIGDLNVIDAYQRLRLYSSLTGVANDFGTTAPEYLAATIFFAQSPTPTALYIGRWAKTATHGVLQCGVMSGTQQTLSNWTVVVTGSFATTIDGSSFTVTGLNFSSATNLNNVASTIQTALQTTGVTVPGLPVLGSALSGSLAQTTYYVKTTYITANGETLPSSEASLLVTANHVVTVASPAANGAGVTSYNVYASSSTGTETKQTASPIAIGTPWQMPGTGLVSLGALPGANTATIAGSTAATVVWNYGQNNFTFSSGSTGTASSFGNLTSAGSGTDISAQLLGTAATDQYIASGVASETAVACVQAMDNLTTYWYGLMFGAGTNNGDIADSDYLAIAPYIESSTASTGNPHIFGLTTSEAAALSSVATTDIGYNLNAAGYTRTFYMYSSANPYGCAGLYGKLLTVNFAAQSSMITLMWKQLAGFNYETLTPNQATSLNTKRYNYFALFNNGVAIVVNGMMASQDFVDEIFGLDGLVNYIQTDLFNLMVTTNTKIPQTDAGMHQLIVTAQNACQSFVNNGYLAAGTWTSAGIGPVQTGQVLSNGYYVWAAPMALQSAAQRGQRISPTIQILAKEAGALHDIVVSLTVNR